MMGREGKDSAEVVKFMALFARLRDWCDDTPEVLSELAKSDSSVTHLCSELHLAAYFLKMNERRHRELFAAPVDPAFRTAWRDYETRYEIVVANVWLGDLFDVLDKSGISTRSQKPSVDQQWEIADSEAEDQAQGIEEAIEFAQENAEQDWRWGPTQEDFIQRIEDGVAAWEGLRHKTGFDLRGVFRRRELIPFVLVPRQVAARHGSAEKNSMLKNLKQAHDAFVYGAPYAALALMRSILEGALRDHYGAIGKDLEERINHARGRLPHNVRPRELHRLRKRANAILHLDPEKDVDLRHLDEAQLEKEIVAFLYVLRALIEGVK